MFSIQMERSRSDSSTSSSSSTLSLSPYGWTPRGPTLSPPTTTTTPYGGSLEEQRTSKPTPYRPSTTATKRAHTAPYALQHETFYPSSGRSAYAYPHWPAGDSLSANSSPSSRGGARSIAADCRPAPAGAAAASSGIAYLPPSSKISDEDLEELDFSRAPQPPSNLESLSELPVGRPSLAVGGISWSQVGGQLAAPAPEPRRRRLPPPPAGYMMHREGSRRGKCSPSRQRNNTAVC